MLTKWTILLRTNTHSDGNRFNREQKWAEIRQDETNVSNRIVILLVWCVQTCQGQTFNYELMHKKPHAPSDEIHFEIMNEWYQF